MTSNTLITDLTLHLKGATDIYIAAALIQDSAFEEIQALMPSGVNQTYLVGIDLPTPPSVLRTFQNRQSARFKCGIYKQPSIAFHPKVYLIKTADQYISIVGSSNLTNGGLHSNIEMNTVTSDETEFNSLLSWFNQLYSNAYPLTEDNIKEYEDKFEAIKENERNVRKIKEKITLKRPPDQEDLFAGIDFSDRFFENSDHYAFRRNLWLDTSAVANRERKEVADKFLELHHQIYPDFIKHGLGNIYCNVPNHIVSLYYHNPNRMQKLDAMWLSYGKSQDEIKQYHKLFPKVNHKDEEDDLQSFINHARLQVRIELREIGIWILFAKNNNGSLFDRQHFSEKMRTSGYRKEFYQRIKNLPVNYRITVNRVTRYVNELQSEDDLQSFCRTDRLESYFIIGADYQITDKRMSKKLLPETVLTEFKRLYPIYEMMRDKRFA